MKNWQCILAHLLCLAVMAEQPSLCYSQSCRTTAKFINSKATLLDTIRNDPRKRLVSLKNEIPGLHTELVYATERNFTHTVLYRHAEAYLLKEPAAALHNAEDELRKRGLGLKLYDAFRPFSVTCHMWKLVADRRYVANPAKGSNHNRGLAVDLTIIDLKTGKELDMGTGFDNFTDTAHHDFMQLSPLVLANRKLLKQVMWKNGFNPVPTEWWHYQWRTKEDFPVIDLDFDELKDIVNWR